MVLRPSTRPVASHFDYQNAVHLRTDAAQNSLKLSCGHGYANSPDPLHDWEGAQLLDLLIEQRVAAPFEQMTGEDVQPLFHLGRTLYNVGEQKANTRAPLATTAALAAPFGIRFSDAAPQRVENE